MFRKLFRSSRPAAPEPAMPVAAVPAGERVYAIGDIHGRADLLDQLLDRIAQDERQRGAAATTIIFLGDLIDRGPDSRGVIDRVMAVKASGAKVHALTGNHEEVFLQAVRGEDVGALRFFCRIGGEDTIRSYDLPEDELRRATYEQLLDMLKARIPADHLDFLEALEDMVQIGDYVFVHAGIRPDTPLEQQRIKDLRWIREGFLDFDGVLDKVVVHGHTISQHVEYRPHRIGIDTGAYKTGVLTAMGFEGSERWLIQTDPAPRG